MDFNSLINKAKDFARKNPDKVRQGLDRAENMANERTGGKYADQIKKGGDAVETQLGVPDPASQQTQDHQRGPTPQEQHDQLHPEQQAPAHQQAKDPEGEQPTGDQPQGQQPTPPQ